VGVSIWLVYALLNSVSGEPTTQIVFFSGIFYLCTGGNMEKVVGFHLASLKANLFSIEIGVAYLIN
jgi:multisubunit Na+/H+ antiporter MnhC subunit